MFWARIFGICWWNTNSGKRIHQAHIHREKKMIEWEAEKCGRIEKTTSIHGRRHCSMCAYSNLATVCYVGLCACMRLQWLACVSVVYTECMLDWQPAPNTRNATTSWTVLQRRDRQQAAIANIYIPDWLLFSAFKFGNWHCRLQYAPRYDTSWPVNSSNA